MRIGWDGDGCSIDFTKGWTDVYKTWFGKKPGPSAYSTWNGIVDGTHFEDEKSFFEWTDKADVWRQLPVVPGAQAALDELYELGHQLTFVSSRHHSIEAITRLYISKHFGHVKPDIRFVGLAKETVICSVYIDDNPAVLERLVHALRPVIVYERPWNLKFRNDHAKHLDVYTAKDWPTVTKLIKEMT